METPRSKSKKIGAKRGKRKIVQSPSARNTISGPRAAKSRRPNAPEADPAASQLQSRDRQIRDNVEESVNLLGDMRELIAMCAGIVKLTEEAEEEDETELKEEDEKEPEAKKEDKTDTVDETKNFTKRRIKCEVDGISMAIMNLMSHFNNFNTRFVQMQDSLIDRTDNFTARRKRGDAEVINLKNKIYQVADGLSAEISALSGAKTTLKEIKNRLKQLQILAQSCSHEDQDSDSNSNRDNKSDSDSSDGVSCSHESISIETSASQ